MCIRLACVSVQLYGYERARLMCEWARKFVLRTSRLPTDEETCTSLASLMKEPLPAQVPGPLPYGRSDGAAPVASGGAPEGSQGFLPSSGEAGQVKSTAEQREQQTGAAAAGPAGAAAAAGAGGAPTRDGVYVGDTGGLPGSKGPLEQRLSAGGVCKKRKDAAKSGENTTKVRKGSDCAGGASSKKGQAPRGASEGTAEAPASQGPRRVARAELLAGSPSGKATSPGENRAEGATPMMSPYLSFKSPDSSSGPYNGATVVPPQAPAGPGQDLPLPESPAPCLPGIPRAGSPEDLPTKSGELGFRGPEAGGGEGLSTSTNPWFEELEQLKKISRPKGGRAKRFNVGKKPFSGVRGIYFQQGLWKVKYRGEQEEAMKLFPYSPGVRLHSTNRDSSSIPPHVAS